MSGYEDRLGQDLHLGDVVVYATMNKNLNEPYMIQCEITGFTEYGIQADGCDLQSKEVIKINDLIKF